MRQSTVNKLFAGDQSPPRTVATFDIGTSMATLFVIHGHTAIVQEYEDELDGFEVFVAVPTNSIAACQDALGIEPYDATLMDPEANR